MKTFIISIGGSGAKIVKAIVSICAAGLINNVEEIHILFVDQDKSNGNLEDSRSYLALYSEINKILEETKESKIFKAKIKDHGIWIPALKAKNFNEVISYNTMPEEKRYLIKTLFDKNEALGEGGESNMIKFEDGFIGRPAFGSVTFTKNLNENTFSADPWNEFIKEIQNTAVGEEPIITLVGSIFGGTGASGIPTIAKRLRDYLPNKNVEKFKIKGILLFPYFIFITSDEETKKFAQAYNFNLKVYIAIKHYEELLKEVFNKLYFIGLDKYQEVKAAPGGPNQKNPANIVELYSALAFRHAISSSNEEDQKGFYLIKRESLDKISWTDIPESMAVKQELSAFLRFSFMFSSLIYPILKERNNYKPKDIPWLFDYVNYVNSQELAKISESCEKIKKFSDEFLCWMAELVESNINIEIFDKEILKDIKTKIEEKEKLPTPLKNMVNLIKDIGKELYLDADEIWIELCKGSGKFNNFLIKLYDQCYPKKGGD